MTDTGNPRCPHCHGTGRVYAARSFRRCECVTGTKESRAAVRRLHSIGAEWNPPWRQDQKRGNGE